MNSNTDNKYQTVIKFLYMLLILSSLVYATAWATTTTESPYKTHLDTICNNADRLKQVHDGDYKKCIEYAKTLLGGNEENKANAESCKKTEEKINEALKAYQAACGAMDMDSDGNLRANRSCNEKTLEKCVAGKDAVDALTVGANLMGMPREATERNCTLSSKDYFQRKDSLNRDIRDINKEIKSEAERLAEIEEKKNEGIQKIYEDLRNQKKEYDKYVEGLGDELQQREEAAQKREVQIATQMQQITILKERARENLYNKIDEANNRLIDVSEGMANEACMIEAKKLYRQLYGDGDDSKDPPKLRSRASLESAMRGGGELKKALDVKFRSCMQKYDIARQNAARTLSNLPEQTKSEIALYDKQLMDMEVELKKIQIDRVNTIAKLDSNKQKALIEAMQNTNEMNARLQQAQQDARNKTLAVGQNMLKNQMTLNQKFSELNTLGSEPLGGTNDKSVTTWVTEFNTAKKELSDFAKGPCCPAEEGETKPNVINGPWTKRCETARDIGGSETLYVPGSRRGRN